MLLYFLPLPLLPLFPFSSSLFLFPQNKTVASRSSFGHFISYRHATRNLYRIASLRTRMTTAPSTPWRWGGFLFPLLQANRQHYTSVSLTWFLSKIYEPFFRPPPPLYEADSAQRLASNAAFCFLPAFFFLLLGKFCFLICRTFKAWLLCCGDSRAEGDINWKIENWIL